MAYRAPSSRRKRGEVKPPNLIPILDAVFIFIFFLLMSASFIKIYEIPSDVPTVSDSKPSKKEPFVLTLKIKESSIALHKGLSDKLEKTFKRSELESLHNYLLQIKQKNREENTIIFEPIDNLTYEEIVQIMDAVRSIRNTDPPIYIKKNSSDEKLRGLFNNIIFGNIQS